MPELDFYAILSEWGLPTFLFVAGFLIARMYFQENRLDHEFRMGQQTITKDAIVSMRESADATKEVASGIKDIVQTIKDNGEKTLGINKTIAQRLEESSNWREQMKPYIVQIKNQATHEEVVILNAILTKISTGIEAVNTGIEELNKQFGDHGDLLNKILTHVSLDKKHRVVVRRPEIKPPDVIYLPAPQRSSPN
jgi:uncharacterized phage infection (PIP) family protein YhgE